MKVAMLTTIDNPFDPFDQYDDWYAYDALLGYHTPQYLARIVITSDDLPVPLQNREIELGIDEIIEENINGLYKKVTREVEEPNAVNF